MAVLGVNIDHVATLRQARRAREPDPVWAAVEAELGGADVITVHLREDRRHIQDRDLELLARTVRRPLNMEMAAVSEMVRIARKIKPAMVTLVPENRREITTEGGLDVAARLSAIKAAVSQLHRSGIVVSAFVDANTRQVAAARDAGFDICEIHTGPYANAPDQKACIAQLDKVRSAGEQVLNAGMRFNAGHGLDYRNVAAIAALPGLSELHIGHAIISRAIFTGLRAAVADMKQAIAQAMAR